MNASIVLSLEENSLYDQYCEKLISDVATIPNTCFSLLLIEPDMSIPTIIVGLSVKGKSSMVQGTLPSLATV